MVENELNREVLESKVEELNNDWLKWVESPRDPEQRELLSDKLDKIKNLHTSHGGIFFKLEVDGHDIEYIDSTKGIRAFGKQEGNIWIVDSKKVYERTGEFLGLMVSPRYGGMVTLTTYDKRGIAFMHKDEIRLEFYLSV